MGNPGATVAAERPRRGWAILARVLLIFVGMEARLNRKERLPGLRKRFTALEQRS